MSLKYSKQKRPNRFKRFLLNAETKYSNKELVINWIILISLMLMLLFGSLFAIYSKNLKINSFSNVGVAIPEPANTFSLVAFVFLLIIITCLISKLIIKRNRKNT